MASTPRILRRSLRFTRAVSRPEPPEILAAGPAVAALIASLPGRR
jgi:hypothetical protein